MDGWMEAEVLGVGGGSVRSRNTDVCMYMRGIFGKERDR